MMVVYFNVLVLDEWEKCFIILFYNIIINFFKEGLEYEGIVFIDVLEMKGVIKYFESGEVEVEVLVVGNDILLLFEDMEVVYWEICNYIEVGKLSWEELVFWVKKVFCVKYELGL